MPDTVSGNLYNEPGRKVTVVGEAFLLRKCKPIKHYTVHWDKRYNGSCYDSFPVTSPSFTGIRFLEPRRRSLTRTGSIIHCSKATNETYVADKENAIWHLRNSTFYKVRKYNVSLGGDMIGLTKVASYGAHLQHYESEMPSRISLLKLLARNQEVIEQLEEFRVHGSQDMDLSYMV